MHDRSNNPTAVPQGVITWVPALPWLVAAVGGVLLWNSVVPAVLFAVFS